MTNTRQNIKNFKQKGITLIALVVTIIVLLILAGISVAMLTGENGILNRAKEASEKTEIATEKEQRQLAMYEASMNLTGMTFQGVEIPAGFAPTRIAGESTVDEGLVIIDSEGNEFVWIPVEDGNIENGEAEKLSDDVPWEKEEYKEMKKSVEKNKGFYIGRYEAGSSTERKGYQKEGNRTTKLVVQRDQYPYVYVGWGKYNEETEDYSDDIYGTGDYSLENNGKGAVYLSRHMYDGQNVGVKSTLCYGVQWDAMLSFLKKSGQDVDVDDSDWGNYYESQFEINRKSVKKQLIVKSGNGTGKYEMWENGDGSFGAPGVGYILTTGATDRNKLKNIYDVAGNCNEWLMKMINENVRMVGRR